jgi:hypothetical protein
MEIAFKPVDTQGLLNILARHPVENTLPQIVAFVEEPGLVESIRRLGQSRPAYQVTLASELGQDGLASLKRPPDLVIVDLFQTEANKQLILDFVKMAPIIKGVPIILIADVEKTPTQHAILSWVGQTIQSSGVVRQEDVLRFVDLAISRYQKNTKR